MTQLLNVPGNVTVIAHGHKRLARQVEVHGVEWIALVSGEIGPEVVDRDLAGIESLRLDDFAIAEEVEVWRLQQLQGEQECVLAHRLGKAGVADIAVEFEERHSRSARRPRHKHWRIGQADRRGDGIRHDFGLGDRGMGVLLLRAVYHRWNGPLTSSPREDDF